ncbi:MAG: nucleotidyltransferase domain-containing protein [Deltaproteobacteria bacterium]|nr:nucleotidyltransferase domain-containing protein [Deltaproteobacteria bacterium]
MSLDLARDVIFVTLGGSHAHGTQRAGSDVDLRGICVVPDALRFSLFERFEQHEGRLEGSLADMLQPRLESHPTTRDALAVGRPNVSPRSGSREFEVKIEVVIYDVAKLLRMLVEANPNALEILFADPSDWLLESGTFRRIYEERRRFLTTKVQATYLGYAMAQLRKIKTHRSWLLSPPREPPKRSDFGLPERSVISSDERDRIERAVEAKMKSYGIDDLELPKAARIAIAERMRSFFADSALEADPDEAVRRVAGRSLGLSKELIDALDRERRFRAAVRQRTAYDEWKSSRNPARAELEAKFGYDTKHAMHLLRLLRTGIEVLESGDLVVKRSDAAELKKVRDGALSFAELEAEAERLRARMEIASTASALPALVDERFVDELYLGLIGRR